jgi:dipeptide/tripeptide permease
MPLLPDLATAGGIALAVFLLALGFLVVFMESVPPRLVAVVSLVAIILAALLAVLGELGIGLVALGFPAALIANGVFEWLTTR